MKNLLLSLIVLTFLSGSINGQKAPSGNPKDFKIKTCLHSVSYRASVEKLNKGLMELQKQALTIKKMQIINKNISKKLRRCNLYAFKI